MIHEADVEQTFDLLKSRLLEAQKANSELEAKVRMFRSVLLDSAKDVIAWCDKNPPAGDALYCITRLRHAIATVDNAMKEGP